MSTPATDSTLTFAGIAASPGIAIGKAYVVDRARLEGLRYALEPGEVSGEIRRLNRALNRSRSQMRALLRRVEALGAGAEHTGILEVHLMMLQDPSLVDGVRTRIESRCINAEWALKGFLEELKDSFSRIDDEYLRERGNDVDQVGQRILGNLMGQRESSLAHVPPKSVVIAHELSPADTIHLLKGQFCGFATELGARTSHIAIVARSMQVPAIVGIESLTKYVASDDLVILDGEAGEIIIRPTEEQVHLYRSRRRRLLRRQRALSENRSLPAVTRDGVRVKLMANVEKLDEVDTLEPAGAEGIGLYRTEYLFLDRQHLPDEEEQVEAYRLLSERTAPHSVVFRTLDVGADKGLMGEQASEKDKGLNPSLGLRGVRYTLRHPELFEPQLRAVLRVAEPGRTKLLVPMVTCIEEVRAVKETLNRCRMELEADGHNALPQIPLGIMIETPAAALIADRLAAEVDFFSIGTNDLIHYTIAADRLDERLAYLYQPVHPAMLRLFSDIISAGASAGIEVAMCGEVAGEPLYTALLVGLGLRSFSMSPLSIPRVKSVIRRMTIKQGEALVRDVRQQESGYKIHEWLLKQFRQLFP